MDNFIDSSERELTPSERLARINKLIGASEQVYVEHCFHKVLDVISFINPAISTPYLETQDIGNGMYEINILVHVSRHKDEGGFDGIE